MDILTLIKWNLVLALSCSLFKINIASSILFFDNELISQRNFYETISAETDSESFGDRNKKVTCHCNICTDAYYCATNGACYISSKFSSSNEKIYTQGCIDKDESDESVVEFFCRESDERPQNYERMCCTKNLCNGNTTLPYNHTDTYSTENIYLLASVSAVIFLTLIAFILFFSCRLDMR